MDTFTRTLLLVVPCALLTTHSFAAQEMGKAATTARPISGWFSSVQAGGVVQLDSDLDDGGNYRHSHYDIQGRASYLWNPQTSATIALSYSYHDFQFSAGEAGSLAALAPWQQVHALSLSTPLRTALNEQWSGFLLPYIRFNGESDAQFNQALTAGLISVASYRVSKDLSLGGGVAVSSQLEDSASIFPLLTVRWNMTPQLRFDLGSSSAMDFGPGLTLSYQADRHWQYTLGGYYQKLRFRLNKDNAIASGVGESQSFPVVASASYNLSRQTKLRILAGLDLAGELSLENSDGDTLYSDSADPALIAGLTFTMRL